MRIETSGVAGRAHRHVPSRLIDIADCLGPMVACGVALTTSRRSDVRWWVLHWIMTTSTLTAELNVTVLGLVPHQPPEHPFGRLTAQLCKCTGVGSQ